jgi:uncharacterized membrane protein
MKKRLQRLFPDMVSAPRTGTIIGTLIVSFMIYVFFPFALPWWFSQVADNMRLLAWVEIFYLVFCFLTIGILMYAYLKDDFLNLQLDGRNFWKTVLAAMGLMVGYVAVLCMFAWALGFDVGSVLRRFPMEHQVAMMSYHYVLDILPGAGTVVLSLVPPMLLLGMHYAVGFAPVCARKQWLGYANIALNLLLVTAFGILWRDQAGMQLASFAMRLPVHLLACWAYQKADNAFAPIAALVGFNLLACAVQILV